ncbi:MAG TPA: Na-translocating system protein MpsC family protein, partial [Nodosilinea sp.]|nr:Na-translocating system protein MpsC family protein [Nodosilinea sp.]
IIEEKLLLVIEDSVTKPEQLLVDDGQAELAEQIREDLTTALRPQIIELIETALGREVVDILTDATLATGRTSVVIILSEPPESRPAAKSA